MRAPAAAAMLLAALAALPCRGIDADTASRFPDEIYNQESGIQPTINIVYQMLHGNEYNHTEADFGSNVLNVNNDDVKDEKCCVFISKVNLIGIPEGARANKETKVKDKSDRRKRVVNMERISEFNMASLKENGVSTAASMVSPAFTIERRRRPGETGSNAPLLNYIFDTYTNTHQHRNGKVSPGNSIYAAAAPELEALVGSTAHLDCKVDSLHDKLVSWVRRKNDEEPMELLTTGTQQYTADDSKNHVGLYALESSLTLDIIKSNNKEQNEAKITHMLTSDGAHAPTSAAAGIRYSARFIPPDIWRLEVKEVRPSDAAHYDCQLSAHPPRTARLTLHVPEVSVRIVDGAGAEVAEQVCEIGSTVALRCEVRGMKMEGGPSLLWYRREALLNDDTTRGGISVRTEFGANGANSVLRVARVRNDDAGRYTCTVSRAPPPSPPPAHVILHVIKGESLAELHQGGSTKSMINTWLPVILTLCVILHCNIHIIY